MLGILALLCGLGGLVCAIIVLIKLFQEKGPLHGILGFICGLYTFIWGWMNATRLGIKNIMIIWTILIILYLILCTLAYSFTKSERAIRRGAAVEHQHLRLLSDRSAAPCSRTSSPAEV